MRIILHFMTQPRPAVLLESAKLWCIAVANLVPLSLEPINSPVNICVDFMDSHLIQ